MVMRKLGGMANEKQNEFLDVGKQVFTIRQIDFTSSKKGNKQYVWYFMHISGIELRLYTLAEKGKRWKLKEVLAVFGILPDENGDIMFDEESLFNSVVVCDVVLETEGDFKGKLKISKVLSLVKPNNISKVADTAYNEETNPFGDKPVEQIGQPVKENVAQQQKSALENLQERLKEKPIICEKCGKEMSKIESAVIFNKIGKLICTECQGDSE